MTLTLNIPSCFAAIQEEWQSLPPPPSAAAAGLMPNEKRGMPFQLRCQHETEKNSKARNKGLCLDLVRFDDGNGSLGIINRAWRFKVQQEDLWFINEPILTR